MAADPIAEVLAEHEAMRAAEAERADRRRRRAEAIRRARAQGVTMQALADALGVTATRVREMELSR